MKPYTVKAVANLLGVSPQTVRAWETRYGAVTPQRTTTNRRIYTTQEVDRLRRILELVNSGHSISSIAALSDQKLNQLENQRKLAKPRESSARENYELKPVLEALQKFDLSELTKRLELARASRSVRDFVIELVSPLLGEVGRLVSTQKMSIAQEHALSAIVRDQIGQSLLLLRQVKSPTGKTASFLFTTPEGDLHEFGILLGAALCANYGLRAHYLGPNLPVDALLMATNALKPSVIILGNTASAQNTARSLEAYLRVLAAQLPFRTEVWIGGSGETPHLRAIFGKKKHERLHSLLELETKLKAFT